MDHPRVGVGVFVNKDGKILLMKRRGSHGAGTWCPPGGHLEFGEEIEDCAVREVNEETGISIKNIKTLGFTNDIIKGEGKHYITIFVQCEIDSGTPTLMEKDKATEMGWFSMDSLPLPLFHPVQNFLKNR